MNRVFQLMFKPKEVAILNYCPIYLKIEKLSKIITIDGKTSGMVCNYIIRWTRKFGLNNHVPALQPGQSLVKCYALFYRPTKTRNSLQPSQLKDG